MTARGDGSYPNLGTTRWIVEIDLGAGHLVLDDGSRWQIDRAREAIEESWSKATTVVVRLADPSDSPRCVLSDENDRTLPALLIGFGSLGNESPQSGPDGSGGEPV